MAIIQKNTIRDEGSTALYAAYTVGTVYTVNNVYTVYKHKYCLNCLMHHICEKRYSQNGVYGNDYYTDDNNNGEGDDDHDDNNDDDDDDSDDDNDDNNDDDDSKDADDDDNDDLSVRVAGGSRGTHLNGSRAGGSLPVLSFPLLQFFAPFLSSLFFFPVKSSSIAKKLNLNI